MKELSEKEKCKIIRKVFDKVWHDYFNEKPEKYTLDHNSRGDFYSVNATFKNKVKDSVCLCFWEFMWKHDISSLNTYRLSNM